MCRFHCPNCVPWTLLSLYGAFFAIFPLPLRADDSNPLKDRFLKEAPTAWKEYRAFADRLQGTIDDIWTRKGDVFLSFRLGFKSNRNCKMVWEEKPLKEPNNRDVNAFNSRYEFSLKRKAKDASWLLTDLHIGPFRGNPEWDDFKPLRLCIDAHLYELPKLVSLPKFRVLKASMVERDGMDLCQIDFDSKEADGVLVLDPNQFWILRHCKIRSQVRDNVYVVRRDMELRTPGGKYPIPKRLVIDQEWWKGAKLVKEPAHGIADFDLKEASSPPDDSEFTLSAFGLPEPMGVEPIPPSRNWIWLAAATVGFAALAILFAWLKRRRVRSVQVSTATPFHRRVS